MPELRKDPISGRWVIISTERSKRPDDFKAAAHASPDQFADTCPFDENREHMTRQEVFAFRQKGTSRDEPGWWVRVVPDNDPLLQIEGDLGRMGVGMFDMMNGIGAHELIVETPRHGEYIPDMEEAQIEKIIWSYRDRMIDLYRDKRFKYVLVFKNHHINSEMTFGHSVSQIVATPILPKQIKEEMAGAKTYFNFKERCLYCDIIRQELADGERMIDENNSFLLFSPFASRSPFEVNIFPKEHAPSFTGITKDEVLDLSSMLKRLLRKLRSGLNDPPYNLMLHTRPAFVGHGKEGATIDMDFHWHVEIVPKMTRLAGFEWGSGFYINPTSPEEGAQFLREYKDY